MSTPAPPGLADALDAVVADMRAAATELATVLDAEHAALTAADVLALDHAGNRKQALMQALELHEAERRQLQSMAPASAEPTGWSEVLRLLALCQERNLRNGALVGQRLTQVRRALAVLTGEPEQGTYGRGGGLEPSARVQMRARA